MGYKEFLQETSTLNGSNLKEKTLNELQSTFDKYFNETPNRVTVLVDDTQEDVIIQHIRYGEDKYDNQLLLTQNDTLVDYGSKITWNGEIWLVINEEKRAIQTHKSWKILLTQNTMVSQDKFNNVYTEPCHVSTSAVRDDGNDRVALTNGSWVVRVQMNDLTNSYYINQRFIFDNKVAKKIVDLNYSEFTGQISVTLEPTQILPEDDLDNNIAFNDFDIDTTPQEGKTGIYFTKDRLDVRIGFENTVNVYEYLSNAIVPGTTFTFRIDDITSDKYNIVASDGNSITIEALEYYYSGTLVAIKDGDLSEYSIPIALTSALG